MQNETDNYGRTTNVQNNKLRSKMVMANDRIEKMQTELPLDDESIMMRIEQKWVHRTTRLLHPEKQTKCGETSTTRLSRNQRWSTDTSGDLNAYPIPNGKPKEPKGPDGEPKDQRKAIVTHRQPKAKRINEQRWGAGCLGGDPEVDPKDELKLRWNVGGPDVDPQG